MALERLTDGTGVSSLTVPKIIKDLIADFLIGGAAALATSNILNIQQVLDAPKVAILAIVGAGVHSGYRFLLKWATTE